MPSIRAVLVLIGVVVIFFWGFVVAVYHPKTSSPVRWWIAENFNEVSSQPAPQGIPIVEAVRSTVPVQDMGDAADDPAIWVNTDMPSESLVLGTNKQSRINIYNLDGELLGFTEHLGAPNNVDLRLVDDQIVVIASDKHDGEQEAFLLNPLKNTLDQLSENPFSVQVEEEAYGACLYRSNDDLFSFITDKSGLITQYKISQENGQWISQHLRSLRVNSQPEGCVVDDQNHTLFIGEEDVGIWSFDARIEGANEGNLIAITGENGHLTADVEGLAIYAPDDNSEAYLIASSQGDHSYAVFGLLPPHRFLGRFQVSADGEMVGDTDGLEVTSQSLGADFPKGMLVVQDGLSQDKNGNHRNQRFTYVSWADIELVLGK